MSATRTAFETTLARTSELLELEQLLSALSLLGGDGPLRDLHPLLNTIAAELRSLTARARHDLSLLTLLSGEPERAEAAPLLLAGSLAPDVMLRHLNDPHGSVHAPGSDDELRTELTEAYRALVGTPPPSFRHWSHLKPPSLPKGSPHLRRLAVLGCGRLALELLASELRSAQLFEPKLPAEVEAAFAQLRARIAERESESMRAGVARGILSEGSYPDLLLMQEEWFAATITSPWLREELTRRASSTPF